MEVAPFDEIYGLEVTRCDADGVEAVVPVAQRVMQVSGIVHGGVYAAMAETLASYGTNSGVTSNGEAALGSSNLTNLLRPLGDGSIRAAGRPIHRGRTTWVWDVEFSDDQGRLCAVSRVTVMVRPAENTRWRADENGE